MIDPTYVHNELESLYQRLCVELRELMVQARLFVTIVSVLLRTTSQIIVAIHTLLS